MSNAAPASDPDDLMAQTPLEARFWTVRRIAGLLGVILLIGGLIRFSDLTAYLIVSIALSFIGRPLMRLCDRIQIGNRSIGSTIGAVLTLSLLFAALGLLVSLFAPLISAEAGALAGLDFEGTARQLESLLAEWMPVLEAQGVNPTAWIDTAQLGTALSSTLGPDGLGGALSGLFSAAGSLVVALFSVAFMTFFFLKDRHLFPAILEALTPDEL